EEFKADSESFFNAGYSQEEAQKKQSYRESLVTKGPTLQEHLIRQLRMQELDENEYKIAELIIGNIDQNGYFQSSIEDIVQALSSKGIEVKSEDANKILAILQTFDPIGIGARDLKECLIIQLKAKEKQNSLCYQIVEHYLPDLARNKLKNIAKALKVSLDKIKEAAKEISLLEPKPGRAFTQSETRRVISRSPDIIVEKIDEQYEVIVNNRELPKLKISAQYKNLLNRKDTPEETKNYLKEKINSALWLIKAVMQRQDTIRRIAECIIDIQKDFFAQGQEEQLKPLTLQEVAQRVGRNESTISRVVNNKYIQTPYGIFKLDYFFSGSYQTEQGEAISSEAVKSQIIALIDEEDHQHPLSDDKIVKLFKAQGINIARRTIAKYREELKIPPSHQRKQ
ncbi:MAG: RNA polymerase factor sigma-54, partial [Candidatus Omnitrophota bacterium]